MKNVQTNTNEPAENHVENSQSSPVSDNQNEVAELTSKVAELTNDLQRTRADFENFRKMIDVQKKQVADMAKLQTVTKFLTLLDNFELAFSNYEKELAPLKKTYEKTLKDLNLSRIEAKDGTPFDPNLHEAIRVEGDGENEVISQVLRPGYTYEGEVLRPTMVNVKRV